jgi:hypothetical protein
MIAPQHRHRRAPDANQTLDYTVSMLRGLAEMAEDAGLGAMARDLMRLIEDHTDPTRPLDSSV